MYGFWDAFMDHFADLGRTIQTNQTVTTVTGTKDAFEIRTETDRYRANQVVSAVPINLTRSLAGSIVGDALDDHISILRAHEDGAAVIFLGVSELEVDHRAITHHQLLTAYDEPLGDGNNMFVTVLVAPDTLSAPAGYRTVMLSTHCDVEPWQGLGPKEYERRKDIIRDRLTSRARTVYPDLATTPDVLDVATPVTYETFTNRPRGATGGYRQTMANTNRGPSRRTSASTGFTMRGIPPKAGRYVCVSR